MKKLLDLKHWQLFVLIIVPVLLFQVVTTIAFLEDSDPSFVWPFALMVMTLVVAVFFGWLYALGTTLYDRLPPDNGMRLTRFRVFFFIPLAYMLLLPFLIVRLSSTYEDYDLVPALLAWIVPLHLFAMCCIFYCIYFSAKALKSVLLQRPATFSDFAGEFFLLWFFPVGIWFLQPQINKLFAHSQGDASRLYPGSNV